MDKNTVATVVLLIVFGMLCMQFSYYTYHLKLYLFIFLQFVGIATCMTAVVLMKDDKQATAATFFMILITWIMMLVYNKHIIMFVHPYSTSEDPLLPKNRWNSKKGTTNSGFQFMHYTFRKLK